MKNSPYTKKQLLFHIPHSSTKIPSYKFYNDTNTLDAEINLLTDWATEKIYQISGIDTITANFSRTFCDVERLLDKDEPMYKKGMGYYYTLTDEGEELRVENSTHKKFVFDTFYKPHHERLLRRVEQKLQNYEQVLIIDCHSFSSKPLKREARQSLDRPDICLGTDTFHTSKKTLNFFEKQFRQLGYSVYINKPYSGSIVPLPQYKKDKRVESLMIEINKKIYMDEESFFVKKDKVEKLNNQLKTIFKNYCVPNIF